MAAKTALEEPRSRIHPCTESHPKYRVRQCFLHSTKGTVLALREDFDWLNLSESLRCYGAFDRTQRQAQELSMLRWHITLSTHKCCSPFVQTREPIATTKRHSLSYKTKGKNQRELKHLCRPILPRMLFIFVARINLSPCGL